MSGVSARAGPGPVQARERRRQGMRELTFVRRQLEWRERADPVLSSRPTRWSGRSWPRAATVTRCPSTSRCPVPMQLGLKLGRIDPAVGAILGPVPFQGPFGIGHECVGQVVATGDDVTDLAIGQTVIVPWAVSCGSCTECRHGHHRQVLDHPGRRARGVRIRTCQRAVGRHDRRRDPGPVRRPHARAGPRQRRPGAGRRRRRQPRRCLAHRRTAARAAAGWLGAGHRWRSPEHRPVRRGPRGPQGASVVDYSTTATTDSRSRRLGGGVHKSPCPAGSRCSVILAGTTSPSRLLAGPGPP